MSYEVHETIVNLFFAELQRDPIEGYKRTMLGQLAAADREVHLRLAERTRSGLPLGPSGELPLDKHIEEVLRLPSIMYLLMPKPKNAPVDKPASNHGPRGGNPKGNVSPDKKIQPKGNKFDKKNRRNLKTPMPQQLRGGTPVDRDGKAICYGYNLGTCHDRACKRGRHVCCKDGCFSSSHTFLTHDKAS